MSGPLRSVAGALARAPRWIRVPLIAFALTRAGILLVAYVSQVLINDSTWPAPYHARPDSILLDVFGSRWDTGFFLRVAREGYWVASGDELPGFSVFPLLPLLIRGLTILGLDPLVAGLFVTNGSLLGACFLLHRLAAGEGGEEDADRAVFYLLVFPTSFFGSAVYSESLLLLCSLGAQLLARRERWGAAGAAAFLAATSRLVGVFSAFLVAGEWLRQRAERSGTDAARPGYKGLLAAVAAPAGTLSYMAYLWHAFGDPIAFVTAQARWERPPSFPFQPLLGLLSRPAEGWTSALAAGRIPVDDWMDCVAGIVFLALGVVLLRRRRWGEGAYVLTCAMLPLCTARAVAERRYVWVLYPVFPLLARWGRHPWVDRAVVTVSLLLLGLSTTLFANWYWVG